VALLVANGKLSRLRFGMDTGKSLRKTGIYQYPCQLSFRKKLDENSREREEKKINMN